jgi:hypothetical protein
MTQSQNFKIETIHIRKEEITVLYVHNCCHSIYVNIPISVFLLTKINKFWDEIGFTYSLELIKCEVGMRTAHSTAVIILNILLEFINI